MASVPRQDIDADFARNQVDTLERLIESALEEMVHEVVELLLGSAPPGWRKIELIYRSTVAVDTYEVLATAIGEPERISVPMKVSVRMSGLREGMYEQDRGSWFTARLTMEPGDYRITYDYDSEPTFVPPLTDDTYVLDFQHYPRSEEHTPDWLRRKLGSTPRSSPGG